MIEEAEKVIDSLEKNRCYWMQYIEGYDKAKKSKIKKEGQNRVVQKKEPMRRLALELCEFFIPIFKPCKREFENGSVAKVSERVFEIVSEIIYAAHFKHVHYLQASGNRLVKNEAVKPPSTEQIKRLYNDRKR